MASILIVEDEELISELIRSNLELVGHVCDQAFEGKEAISKMNDNTYDLILLDVMIPYVSGFDLMQYRKQSPVIFVTAKDNLKDKLQGLGMGAEDYIVKPFEMLELIARVNIVLKRYCQTPQTIKFGDVSINMEGRIVTNKNEIVDLTPKEFDLLEAFVINRNIALTREKLLEIVWGFEYEGDTRTVDVHVQKLRKKLGIEDRIKTVYKRGYRLEL